MNLAGVDAACAWPATLMVACAGLQVFFKMDKTGEGEEVQLADLPQAKELAFQGFGHDLFQEVGAQWDAWVCMALAASALVACLLLSRHGMADPLTGLLLMS